MTAITTFDSAKESLLDLLRSIRYGKTQFPDFQRGWVWDDEHICSLLASISLSYPIGAVMMLQTGNANVGFKPRAVEEVKLNLLPEPERLILDGQQRLTSLFQSLFLGQAVTTPDVRMQRAAGIDEARMDQILQSHLIDPAGLRADDFDAFFKARESALLERIERAMGKTIARDAVVMEDTSTVEVEDTEMVEI